MDPLEESEKHLLKLFRHQISDIIPQMSEWQKQDVSLMRFIRAREGKLDKAETMLRRHMMWREENDIDNIFDVDLPDMEAEFPIIVAGQDKEGFPVIVANAGLWDVRKAVEAGQRDEFGTHITKFFEQILKVTQHLSKEDKAITQIFIVGDLEEFSFRQLASKEVIQLVLELVSVFEDQYPEILRAVYVINAPKIFQILWALIKPMLTKRTLAKINLMSCNKEAWKSELKKRIDFETNFPSSYGGGVTTCLEYKFKYGVDVFPEDNIEKFGEKEMTTVHIEARKSHRVTFDMNRGSKLSWNFRTEGCDIGFSLHHDSTGELIKYSRVDSHLLLQHGQLICAVKGKYTFEFDNSYSSYRAKTLRYCIRARQNEED